jgi:glycosyltransferase involved in cell wall biosynthesis
MRESCWDRVFVTVNDRVPNRWIRWGLRWLVLHSAALGERDAIKVFTSHHSPFFASGHLVIIHDVIPFRMPRRYPAQTFYTRRFLATVMRSADAVITISETVRLALLELFPEFKSKLVVVPSYSPKIDADFHERKERTASPGGRFLMVGMTRRHKNLDWGADAIELAAGRRPGLRLDAVGVWREFWPEVVTAAASPARIAKLVLHDYVPDHVLDELYREARALLYLSSDEGMGLPPLEALARGCPVVCSDIPIFREVCGDAAFYVPLRDTAALASLLERLASGALDAEVARKLELGQQRIQAYGAVRLARDWRLLLDAYASFRAPVVV